MFCCFRVKMSNGNAPWNTFLLSQSSITWLRQSQTHSTLDIPSYWSSLQTSRVLKLFDFFCLQIVIMLYEDPTKDTTSEERQAHLHTARNVDLSLRFHVELHFSPGVNCCVQKELPPGPGFRPHSRNHEQVLRSCRWQWLCWKECDPSEDQNYDLIALECRV